MQRDKVYYINGMKVNASMYDFCIDCYNTAQNYDDQKPDVTLMMSPQHFKKMCSMLINILQEYESNVSKIELHEDPNVSK